MTPLQRRIGLVALLVSAVAFIWMLTHRRQPDLFGDVAAPKFLELTAKGGEKARVISDGAELSQNELLDFQIQVFDLSFVYIVKVQNGATSLAWGHKASEPVWETGVYAPDWNNGRPGMPFSGPGAVEVYAVTSPQPLVDVPDWDVAALKNPHSRCPHCASSSVHFTIK